MSSPPSSIDIDVASDKPYCAGVDNKFFIPVAASLVNRRLFGLIEVPFVRYELSKSYVDQFRTLSGKHPICEVALLQCDAKLSNLFPGFEMPDCDGLKLKSLRVIHRNFTIESLDIPGWHIESNVTIDSSWGNIHRILHDMFHIDELKLYLHCALEDGQSWDQPLSLDSFLLEGVASGPLPVSTEISLAKIGLKLIGHTVTSFGNLRQDTKEYTEFSYRFFGTVVIDKPNWGSEVVLDFELTKLNACTYLSARATCEWRDLFDIKGLTLRGLTLGVEIPSGAFFADVVFFADAQLELGHGTFFDIKGTFSFNGSFELSASTHDFTLHNVRSIYRHFFDEDLPDLPFDIELDCGELVIFRNETEHGLYLSVTNLRIGPYVGVGGKLLIRSDQFFLRVAADGNSIDISNTIRINKPYLEVLFKPAKTSHLKEASFKIAGKLEWRKLAFDVGAHLYTLPNSRSMDYTIYGNLVNTARGTALTFGEMFEEVKGCSMIENVILDEIVIAVVSQQDPSFEALIKSKHQIEPGFQIFAALSMGHIGRLKDAVSSDEQLMLAARWSPNNAVSSDEQLMSPNNTVSLAVQLPTNMLKFGCGVKMDSLMLAIETGAPASPPSLYIKGGLIITVSGQEMPLTFGLSCEVTAIGDLKITGGMYGMWNDPFGISPKLSIGNLALMGTLQLPTFTPKGFGVKGVLHFGKATAEAQFYVSADSKQFIYFRVKTLTLDDIINFIDTVFGVKIPKQPNFVTFNLVSLYICSCDMRIDRKDYSRGIRFTGDITILGKDAFIYLDVTKNGLIFDGTIDPFEIGPFKVRGAVGFGANVHLDLSKSNQEGSINGRLRTDPDIDVELVGNFHLNPLDFYFSFKLDFEDLFTFDVFASTSKVSGRQLDNECPDISDADFVLTADFAANLDTIAILVSEVCTKMKEDANKSTEARAEFMLQKREEYRNAIKRTRNALDYAVGSPDRRLASILQGLKRATELVMKITTEVHILVFNELPRHQLSEDSVSALRSYRDTKQRLPNLQDMLDEVDRDYATKRGWLFHAKEDALRAIRQGAENLPLGYFARKYVDAVHACYIKGPDKLLHWGEELPEVAAARSRIEIFKTYSMQLLDLQAELALGLPEDQRNNFNATRDQAAEMINFIWDNYTTGNVIENVARRAIPIQASLVLDIANDLGHVKLDIDEVIGNVAMDVEKNLNCVIDGIKSVAGSVAPDLLQAIVNTLLIKKLHLKTVIKKADKSFFFEAEADLQVAGRPYHLDKVAFHVQDADKFVWSLVESLLTSIKNEVLEICVVPFGGLLVG